MDAGERGALCNLVEAGGGGAHAAAMSDGDEPAAATSSSGTDPGAVRIQAWNETGAGLTRSQLPA